MYKQIQKALMFITDRPLEKAIAIIQSYAVTSDRLGDFVVSLAAESIPSWTGIPFLVGYFVVPAFIAFFTFRALVRIQENLASLRARISNQ